MVEAMVSVSAKCGARSPAYVCVCERCRWEATDGTQRINTEERKVRRGNGGSGTCAWCDADKHAHCLIPSDLGVFGLSSTAEVPTAMLRTQSVTRMAGIPAFTGIGISHARLRSVPLKLMEERTVEEVDNAYCRTGMKPNQSGGPAEETENFLGLKELQGAVGAVGPNIVEVPQLAS